MWGMKQLRKNLAQSDVRIKQQFGVASDHANKIERTEAEKTIASLERDSLQIAFATYWRQLGGSDLLRSEVVFHPQRKWRFDFAVEKIKVSIEIDGGTWSKDASGHNWGTGIRRDCEKQNAAIVLGWRTFRLTSDMLSRGEYVNHIKPIVDFVNQELAEQGDY